MLKLRPHIIALFASLLLAGAQGSAMAATCGMLVKTAYGPHDYRDYSARARVLPVVERYHFTPGIEDLSAKPSRYLAGDLSYTLNKFPNHYRALDAMSRLAARVGKEQPEGSDHSLDCWFQRAAVFQPGDGIVRLTYGIHLERFGRLEEALKHMEAGLRLEPGNAKILYYLGKLHLRLGHPEEARRYALEAQTAGFPIADLRDALTALGHWDD